MLKQISKQNAEACLLTGSSFWAHVQPVLHQLYWLQLEYQVRFKVVTLTFKALSDQGPTYLKDHLLPFPRRALCSQDKHILVILGLRDVHLALIRTRAFLALAPASWNKLLEEFWALKEHFQFCNTCKMKPLVVVADVY